MYGLRKRGLSLFMVLVLVVSLVSGMGVGALADYEENVGELEQAVSGSAQDIGALSEEEEKLPEPEELENLEDEMTALAGTYSGGSGTEDDPYLISTLADMTTLQTDRTTSYFKLMDNIVLPSSFCPIGSNNGTSSSTYCFKGHFDGNGHKLTLDNWNSSNWSGNGKYVGLFGYLASGASIENLTVDGKITTTGGGSGFGAIAALAYSNTTIKNCISNVELVSEPSSPSSAYFIGGIAGKTQGSVTQCVNNGTITAKGGYVGGIAGYATASMPNYCLNTGDINVTTGCSGGYVGGIAGRTSSGTLYGCGNTGKVTYEGTVGTHYTGVFNGTDSTLTACYSTKDAAASAGTLRTGHSKIDAFDLVAVWAMNNAEGTNSLVWSFSSADGVPTLADTENGAVVRVTFTDGTTTEYGYTTVGSSVDAPEAFATGYSFNDGSFVPGTTAVTGDITVNVAAATVTKYTVTYVAGEGVTGTVPEAVEYEENATIEVDFTSTLTKEGCRFVGWSDGTNTYTADGATSFTITAPVTLTAVFEETVVEDGTAEHPYLVEDLADLTDYADKITSGESGYIGAYYQQTADIDASGTDWTPIGTSSYKFAGVYDGQGYSIKLGIDGTENYQALFYYIGKDGTVKNLVTTGTVSGANGVAGIAVYNYGTISGCVNKADISATANYAGGICANLYGGSIIDCGNEGDITVTRATGGTLYAGGIAGQTYYSTSGVNGGTNRITNCYNWGAVSVTNYGTSYATAAGGIAGMISSTSSGIPAYIINCYNAGALSATNGKTPYVGGIAGYTGASSSYYKNAEIVNCYWADASQVCINKSNASYGATLTDCAAYTDAASLLTSLNTYAAANSLTAWVADTGYGSKPAFRVSVVETLTISYTGDYVGTDSITSGTRVTLPECEEDGYYFTFDIDGTAFDGKSRLYANTTINVTKHIYTYTVTYSAGTGTGSVPATATYDWGTTVNVDFTTTPTKDGYTFFGWTDSTDGNTVYTSDGTTAFVIKEDRTLTAKYQGYPFKGLGTADSPYEVDCAAALKAIAGLVNQNDADYISACYIQTADIDMTGESWTPIGKFVSNLNSSTYFQGSYDGGGKTIKNLAMSFDSDKYGALFMGLKNATVKDLTVTGSLTSSVASSYAAGLAAYVCGTTVIDGCVVKMDITNTGSYGVSGGLVGWLTDSAVIRNSGHEGAVSGAATVAGLVAKTDSSARGGIYNSYHGNGAVSGTGSNVGGIVGLIGGGNFKLLNCYNSSEVTTTSGTPGGVIGNVSSYKPTVTSCFYSGSTAQSIGSKSATNTGTFETTVISAPGPLQNSLNTWVNENTTEDVPYSTWAVTEGENGGYPIFGTPSADVFYITYDLNGAEGKAPADFNAYSSGDKAAVLGIGDITYKYHSFAGWATSAKAAEAEYTEGSSIDVTGNVTLFAVWKEATAWTKTGDKSYSITDAAGLLELADKVNSANGYVDSTASFEGYTFKLTADLDMTGTDFAAIGYYTTFNSYSKFNGTFDGGGHTVTYALSGIAQGLFGYTGADAVVKNVKTAGTIAATNSTSSDMSKSSSSGGVVGWNLGTVSDCSSSVVISGAGKYVGGIVGRNAGTVDGCFYTGTGITGIGGVGGIAGFNSGKVINCAVKSGAIAATGTDFNATAGGISGSSDGTLYNNYSWAESVSGYYVGGTVGSGSGDVRNNYSTAVLNGTSSTGGVIGNVSGGTILNNYWLTGTAADDAGYDPNSKAYKNGIFSADGTMTETPIQLVTPGGDTTNVPGTLLDILNKWVEVNEDSALSTWIASETCPMLAIEQETVTVTYTGDYSGTQKVVKGADAVLPTPPAGTTYTFTVNGEAWDGKNLTANVTVTVTAATTGLNGSGTENDPYLLMSETDILFLDAKVCAADAGYVSAYYRVENDITFASAFTGIGAYGFNGAEHPFSGTIDGNGKTITVSITQASDKGSLPGVGFINYASGAYIHDLTVAGTVTGSTGATGGLIANYDGATKVENCVNKAAVSTTSGNIIGGIVGGYAMMTSGTVTITGCTNEGTVSTGNGALGVGGILGADAAGKTAAITRCVNKGTVRCTDSSGSAGGIAGTLVGSASQSYNTGKVENTGKLSGGLVGTLNGGTVSDCYSTGDVSCTASSAGSSHYAAGLIAKNTAGTAANCYTVGTLTGDGATLAAIGTSTGTVTNCWCLDGQTAGVDGVGTKTATDMKSADFLTTLGDKFAADSLGVNSGYPVLVWTIPVRDSYTVTYTGDYTAEVTVKAGADAELPANPENGTYSFTVGGAAWDGKSINADVTVTVKLTKYTYTVTYTGDYEAKETVEHGGSVSLPECTEAGKYYSFTVNGQAWDGTNITASVTVTVKKLSSSTGTYDIWDGTTVTKWTTGSGSEANPYLIESGANLAYLQQQVAAGTQYASTFFKVTKDLDMTKATWAGIGADSYGTSGMFLGSFDGDGHSIKINAVGSKNIGLFTSSNSSTVIKNVVVEGTVTGSGQNAGGIIGCNYGTITGCVNKAAVTGSTYVGGIVGQNYGGSVLSCGNEGSVTATGSSSYAGGIIGDMYDGNTVANCYNWGTISGGQYTGGIVGLNYCYGKAAAVTNCYSSGELVGSKGGVVGYVKDGGYGKPKLTVTNCWWLSGTASAASTTSTSSRFVVTGGGAFTDYGKLLTSLNSARGDYAEWFADTANGSKPSFRQTLIDSHVITFVADGVTVETITFSEGETSITVPAVPAKTGYVGVWEDYTLGTENITVNAVYSLIGDVNGDGTVNAFDAMLALRASVGLAKLTALQQLAADVDGSGAINSTDARIILRYAIGMLSAWTVTSE